MIAIIANIVIFLVITFYAYATNMLMWYELLPMVLFLFPIHAYTHSGKLWASAVPFGTLFVAIRYIANILLALKAPNALTVPLTIEQDIIKQTVGVGEIFVVYLWLMFIFATSASSMLAYAKQAKSYTELIRDSRINRVGNLFNTTALISVLVIFSFLGIYKMNDLFINVIVCQTIIAIIVGVFFVLTDSILKSRKEEFVTEYINQHNADSDDIEDLDEAVKEDEPIEQSIE